MDKLERYKGRDAWVDPRGRFIVVPTSGHNEYASDWMDENIDYKSDGCYTWFDWLEKQNIKTGIANYRVETPYEYLEHLGWFRLMHWAKSVQPEDKTPRRSQQRVITDWKIINEIKEI